ncbi:hypothetical protein FQN50_005563 [Emmonsiellopsis sp. PD_5]|nr:hypothetical protein FQN50_005563 [Emmonsiellopsis sp. PD_5]
MSTLDGLINTPALAIQYDRAKLDPNEDSATGLWDRLLNIHFDANSWIVTPQKRQEGGQRPDFIIERIWQNSTVIEVVVIEAKPQHQTMSQDHQADMQVFEYAMNSLHAGQQKGQKKIYALRVVGVHIMAYRVLVNEGQLTPMVSDYLDPKRDSGALLQVFNTIKGANVFD